MSEKTVLVRYSLSLDTGKTEEDFIKNARVALSGLFSGFAHALMDDEDIDFTADHEIELSSETEHWDQHFVLKLIRIDNDN